LSSPDAFDREASSESRKCAPKKIPSQTKLKGILKIF